MQEYISGQSDDCATACSLDYPHFTEHYKLTDLSKKQVLDAHLKATEQGNFTGDLD